MKKIELTQFVGTNIAKLSSVYIQSDGGDILITGENGAGKSTIQKAILWTLMGTALDGEKLMPVGTDKMPYTEVELYDGTVTTKMRKELNQHVDSRGKVSRSVDCYLNGLAVTQKDYQEYFRQYVPDKIFYVMIGLGNFFKLKVDEQRELLTKTFAEVDEAVLMSEIGLDTKGVSIESYRAALNGELRRIKQETVKIAAQIELLESQMVEVADDRKSVEVELLALETEFNEVSLKIETANEVVKKVMAPRERLDKVNGEYYQVRSEYSTLKSLIEDEERRLESLRDEWASVEDTCPTCGQPIQSAKVKQIRDKIADEGAQLSAKIEDDKNLLAEIVRRGKTLKAERAELLKKVDNINYNFDELNDAMKRRSGLEKAIAERKAYIEKVVALLARNEKKSAQIDSLVSLEKSNGKEMTECERQLALIEEFTRRKMEMVTGEINSKFEFVEFKMFETLKNGEIKNTCEATLDGVPYASLSKGEKLKVALDVLNAFQKVCGVMFSLIIDDAESYTSNSLIDVPNQKILLKAVEGAALEISVAERRQTA